MARLVPFLVTNLRAGVAALQHGSRAIERLRLDDRITNVCQTAAQPGITQVAEFDVGSRAPLAAVRVRIDSVRSGFVRERCVLERYPKRLRKGWMRLSALEVRLGRRPFAWVTPLSHRSMRIGTGCAPRDLGKRETQLVLRC